MMRLINTRGDAAGNEVRVVGLTSGESEWDREWGAGEGGGVEGKGGLCRRRGKEGEGAGGREGSGRGGGSDGGEVKLGRKRLGSQLGKGGEDVGREERGTRR